MYSIYILRCEDESLYTGITTNMQRRYQEHFLKLNKGAKYTHSHSVKKIEAIWTCETRSLAAKLEYWLKTLTKYKKEMIIQDNYYLDIYLKEKINPTLYQRQQDKGDEFSDY